MVSEGLARVISGSQTAPCPHPLYRRELKPVCQATRRSQSRTLSIRLLRRP
jgi:hypothetical protein